jgi:glycosyltransferase involved in cell wall biosynthesis
MVQLMLDGFGGDQRKKGRTFRTNYSDPDFPSLKPTRAGDFGIACYHVNARLSSNLEDIGAVRPGKFFLLFGYCLQAIWCRFRYGVNTFYYVPAPGKQAALYRDWLVMFFCRPFFKKVVLHWHATGMAKWLETAAQMRTRSLTYQLMKQVDLSVVLLQSNLADPLKLMPQRVAAVANGIPDPCSSFELEVHPRRLARYKARTILLAGQNVTAADLENTGGDPHIFKVLFLAHCTREKGLFDTVDAIALANQQLVARKAAVRIRLTIAGDFLNALEKTELQQRLLQPDLKADSFYAVRTGSSDLSGALAPVESWVEYRGFARGREKDRLFSECDCFCFPSYIESFGLVLAEAMAFGLPIVTTRRPGTPELLPPGYCELVDIRAPDQIAEALLAAMSKTSFQPLRHHFVNHFTVERHLASLAAAFRSVEPAYPTESPAGPAQLASQHSPAS